MSIQWTEDLATGVDEIDNQHREIFSRTNRLFDACRAGNGKKEIEGVIKFLEDYVIEHFSLEEQYMTQHGYPGYYNHKAQHMECIKNIVALKKQFETDGPGVYIVVLTNTLVINWLQAHIRKVDTELGAFLKDKV